MNFYDLKTRVRSLTRDLSNSIFRDIDLVMYMNESIDRIRQVVPELRGMKHLKENEDELLLLPDMYHHLLAVYCASRCFGQDERHYQATTLMNEFEFKVAEMKSAIENGECVIEDADGNIVENPHLDTYVVDNYFERRKRSKQFDEKPKEKVEKEIVYWSDLNG